MSVSSINAEVQCTVGGRQNGAESEPEWNQINSHPADKLFLLGQPTWVGAGKSVGELKPGYRTSL